MREDGRGCNQGSYWAFNGECAAMRAAGLEWFETHHRILTVLFIAMFAV
jgi:hypothetical protein